MSNKLCLNCMKPNHLAQDCRSSYRCKANSCGRKHNTLLHEDRAAAPAQQNSHQSNAAIHTDDSEGDELEECLLMTSQVTITGPTGKFLTVRALLDSGSTLSILSTRVMKYLKLKDTGRTVSISGVSSRSTNRRHPLAKATLTSAYKPDWSKRITVAGMDEVTRKLPLQEETHVRKLTHIKELDLADQHFDKPRKIDLLLGQNVWRHLFLPGMSRGTEKEPEIWLTVFGWTILGTYTPSSQNGQQSAITHVVSSVSETELSTDQLLRKFWELEEPTVDGKVMTPTELQVEKHYEETHSYIKSQKRYMVRLPKVEENTTLGESKTAAINRAKGNWSERISCKISSQSCKNI